MTTSWFYPNSVTQDYEVIEHISWNDVNNFSSLKHPDGNFCTLSAPLLHIANSYTNDIKMKTWYLYLTQFNILPAVIPTTISGIEVEINMNRGGRITDETIQLLYNNDLIGENRANFDLSPNKFYGGSTDVWGLTPTSALLTNSTFGIAVRFQSHPSWPHNEYPRIDYIRIRIH